MLKRMSIRDLNPYMVCVLCGGYLVDATTIVECLHSSYERCCLVCRSCIVTYLGTSRQCPVCDTEVHKTRPLLCIRPDRTLQEIVNKLVPGLYFGEVQRRRAFDENKRSLNSLPVETGKSAAVDQTASTSKDKESRYVPMEDAVCITLEYFRLKRRWDDEKVFPTRYLRCPSAVTVSVLKKFLVMKFAIPDTHKVELIRSDEIIDGHLTLKEVIGIYGLYTKHFLDLQYVFLEVSADEDRDESEHAFKTNKLKMEEQMQTAGTETDTRPKETEMQLSTMTEVVDDSKCTGDGDFFEATDIPSLPETPPSFELSPCSREIQPMA